MSDSPFVSVFSPFKVVENLTIFQNIMMYSIAMTLSRIMINLDIADEVMMSVHSNFKAAKAAKAAEIIQVDIRHEIVFSWLKIPEL